jgi:hypothetical protein
VKAEARLAKTYRRLRPIIDSLRTDSVQPQ